MLEKFRDLYHKYWFYIYVSDPLERAGKSFVQVFLVGLLGTSAANVLAANTFDRVSDALIPALFAAVASLILTYATILAKVNILEGWLDLGVRVLKTFLSTYAGVIAAGPTVDYSVSVWKAGLGLSLSAAGTAFLLGLNKLTASHETIGASTINSAPVLEHEMRTAVGHLVIPDPFPIKMLDEYFTGEQSPLREYPVAEGQLPNDSGDVSTRKSAEAAGVAEAPDAGMVAQAIPASTVVKPSNADLDPEPERFVEHPRVDKSKPEPEPIKPLAAPVKKAVKKVVNPPVKAPVKAPVKKAAAPVKAPVKKAAPRKQPPKF